MEKHRIGSVPIVDADSKPIGIFTRQDVIGRVVLPQRPLTVAMRDVMSAPAITLPADATAGDAALVMAQRGIRHVVVVDGTGRVAGVVSERDLFSLQRLSVRELASTIRRAADVPALVQCASDIRALSHSLVAQGVAAGQLTRMISSLNDQLAVRIIELTAPRSRSVRARVVLAGHGVGGTRRADDRHRPGQRPHLRRRRRDDGARRDPRAPPAVRARRQRGDGPLRLSAVQGRRDGDEPALVREPPNGRRRSRDGSTAAIRQSLLAANIFFDFRALWGESRLADALRADIARARRQFAVPEADVRQRARATARRSTGAASCRPRRTTPASRASTSR